MNLNSDLANVNTTFIETKEDVGPNHVVPLVANALGLKTEASKEYLRFALANALLMDRKQLDYGPHNIGKHGVHGVVVRMSDKMERLANLFNKGRRRKAVNESIIDTFRDIANYGVIAMMLEEGKWPGYTREGK